MEVCSMCFHGCCIWERIFENMEEDKEDGECWNVDRLQFSWGGQGRSHWEGNSWVKIWRRCGRSFRGHCHHCVDIIMLLVLLGKALCKWCLDRTDREETNNCHLSWHLRLTCPQRRDAGLYPRPCWTPLSGGEASRTPLPFYLEKQAFCF